MTAAPGRSASVPPPRPSGPVLRQGLAIIGRGMWEQRRIFSLALIGSVLWGGAVVATAWAVGYVTDRVIEPAVIDQEVTAAGLWMIFGVLFAVLMVNVTGVVMRRIAATIAGFNLQASSRRQVTRQYLRLPLSWHHAHPSGQLLSNAHADIEATWQVFNPLPMALGVIVMLLIAGTQMVLIDPMLALVAMLVFPALLVANLVFQRVMSPKITYAQQLRAEVAEVAHESFEAGLVVKAMGREDQEARRFETITNRLRDSLIDVGRTRGTFDPVIEGIPILGTLAVLAVGTSRVAGGHLNAADVVQVAFLFSLIAFPVRSLGWVLAEIPRSVVGYRRVASVLRARGAMQYGADPLPATGAAQADAHGVDYSYLTRTERAVLGADAGGDGVVALDLSDRGRAADQHQDGDGGRDQNPGEDQDRGVAPPAGFEATKAIHGVDLQLPAGGTVALVGPTGSGKSTLANLMLRLVDPDRGSITIDGVDLRSLEAGRIPQIATLVAQQTFMFDESVRGNVTLGGDFTDAEVRSALETARATGFVDRLPGGLDSVVGERGGTLSGGQRQRIALARAIVRRPRLLVLDDATSAVDPAVEQSILSALRETRSGMTVLVIAYRMATITLADRVVYIEGGAVVDAGTHAELVARCDGYARLTSAYQREAQERATLAAQESESDSAAGTGTGTEDEAGERR